MYFCHPVAQVVLPVFEKEMVLDVVMIRCHQTPSGFKDVP